MATLLLTNQEITFLGEVFYTMLLDQSKVAKMLEDEMPAWDKAWKDICHVLGWDKNELPEQLDIGPLLCLPPQRVPGYVHTFLMDYIRSFSGWAVIFGKIFEVCLSLSLFTCALFSFSRLPEPCV